MKKTLIEGVGLAFYYLSPPILIVDSCHGDEAYHIEAEDGLIWGRDVTYGQFEEIQNDVCLDNVEWNRGKFQINRIGRINIQKIEINPAQYLRGCSKISSLLI